MNEHYDKVIVGAGIYGLYAAYICGKRGEKVLVVERDKEAFMRATYINQARVHMGYHYPRSLNTANKSVNYFDRFNRDYSFCINSEFEQIYATSSKFSWTNANQFIKFCKDTKIPCQEVIPSNYFRHGMCDGAFLTKEYTYDAKLLRNYFLAEISKFSHVKILYNFEVVRMERNQDSIMIYGAHCNDSYKTSYLLNATYASTNQISHMLDLNPFPTKYELCEIILCKTNENLTKLGITVMDGPFFSIMPFGKTGYHSLTSVTFTPHTTCYDALPHFQCQENNPSCNMHSLYNCNDCPNKPQTAWTYMSSMAKKYMREEFDFYYDHSLFSMKPILKASEIDDSRPTVIKKHLDSPTFVSVLSGKINTVYDLEEIL